MLRNQANVGRQPLGGSAAGAPPGRMPCGPVAAVARKPLNCRGLRGAGRVSRARHGDTSQLTLAVRRKLKLAGRPGGDAGRTPGAAALLRNQANVGRQPLGGSAANAPPGRMPFGPVAAGARKPLNCRGLRGAGRVSRARHGYTSQLTLAVRRPLAVGCLPPGGGSVAG